MYNPQLTVDKIKELRIQKGISATELNEACGLNKNTIAMSANSKNGLSAKILLDISEYLQCSVDYLLNKTSTSMHYQSNNNGNIVNGNNGNNSPLTVNPDNSSNQDTIKQNFITLFDNLSPENQIEVMYFTKQLMKKEK